MTKMPRRTSERRRDPAQTPACRGVVHGADRPLDGALRRQIVQLLAEALAIDFVEKIDADGQTPTGTEPNNISLANE
jgi:hypothetical protein